MRDKSSALRRFSFSILRQCLIPYYEQFVRPCKAQKIPAHDKHLALVLQDGLAFSHHLLGSEGKRDPVPALIRKALGRIET